MWSIVCPTWHWSHRSLPLPSLPLSKAHRPRIIITFLSILPLGNNASRFQGARRKWLHIHTFHTYLALNKKVWWFLLQQQRGYYWAKAMTGPYSLKKHENKPWKPQQCHQNMSTYLYMMGDICRRGTGKIPLYPPSRAQTTKVAINCSRWQK